MKVLIADKFEKVGIDGLKELGCTVVVEPDVKAEELPARLREVDPHILIVRGKKVTADTLEAGHRAHPGDPRRRRHRHHRRRSRVEPRRLRLQLSRQELDRGGRAGAGTAARLRPAHPRPGGRPAAGQVEQGASTPRRGGLYGRTLGIVGLGQIGREVAVAGPRVRDAGRRLVAQPHARGGGPSRHRLRRRRRSRWRG